VFAIRTIDVEGASPVVEERVRAALGSLKGTSLVKFESSRGTELLGRVSYVASARFDRAFPSTLRVIVTPERPVAVIRRARDAWVVSARARVLAKVDVRDAPPLPRVWIPASSEPIVGAVLGDDAADVVRALVPLGRIRLPVAIRSAKLIEGGELALVMESGVQVLLGSPYELRLKLAIASRVLSLAGDAKVIDASVPDRVVTRSTVTPNS
jgi:cell division protein FtsQ